MKLQRLPLSCLVSAILVLPAAAHAVNLVDLGLNTVVFGLGDTGQVLQRTNQSAGLVLTGPGGQNPVDYASPLVDGVSSGLRAMSRDGQYVAGYLRQGSTVANTFVAGIQGDHVTPLSFPSGTGANWPDAVNDLGMVAGTYQDASGLNHAFVSDAQGVVTPIVPQSASSLVIALNNRGQVLGLASVEGGDEFFYTQSGTGTLIVPSDYQPYALSDSGIVAGLAANGHLVMTKPDGQGLIDLGSPGDSATFVSPVGVSDSGLIVGNYSIANSITLNTGGGDFSNVPVSYTPSVFVQGLNGQGFQDINSLISMPAGARLTYAQQPTGLTNSGQFIAAASNGHSYLVQLIADQVPLPVPVPVPVPLPPTLPPVVPEPASFQLMGLGLLGLMLAFARQRPRGLSLRN